MLAIRLEKDLEQVIDLLAKPSLMHLSVIHVKSPPAKCRIAHHSKMSLTRPL